MVPPQSNSRLGIINPGLTLYGTSLNNYLTTGSTSLFSFSGCDWKDTTILTQTIHDELDGKFEDESLSHDISLCKPLFPRCVRLNSTNDHQLL
jgi:hypothetical protein